MLYFGSPTNRHNFQLSFGCTHVRVQRGHPRRHGKQSPEILTAERADYTHEMDCHYSIPGQNIDGVLANHDVYWYASLVKHYSFWNIYSIFRVPSARAVGRTWNGNSRTDSPNNCLHASLAIGTFPLPWINQFFFCIPTLALPLKADNVAPPFILLI